MNTVLKTHEELLSSFIDDFQLFIKHNEARQLELKLSKRTSDQAKATRTRKDIRDWIAYCRNRY